MLTPFLGEIVLYAFNFAPQTWSPCAGQLLPLSQNTPLFLLLKNQFGGDGVSTFALPDYRKVAPAGMQYCIALQGVQPTSAPRPANLGEIALLPYATPGSWLNCNGQWLTKSQYPDLFQIIGVTFGGGFDNFKVPKLTTLAPLFPTGLPPTTQPVNRPAPTQSLYCISSGGALAPAPAFQGEVRLMPSWSVPAGWVPCNGQLLPINVNQAMFSLLGTTFGGDGRMKFALPNLSRIAVPTGLQYCINIGGTYPPR